MIDGHFRLRYMGYCLSQMPPEEFGITLKDFVRYAKHQLCVDRGYLMHDPIWESYDEHQILVEYFAQVFTKSPEARKDFEAKMKNQDSDFTDWADEMEAENKKEIEKLLKSHEENLSFRPDSLGE